MDILNTKIKNILTEKNLKLRPENIKKDVTAFGITGTYEGQQPNLQSKSVEITENGTTTITTDSGYDGLNQVEVTTNVSGSGGKNNQANMGFYVTSRTTYVKSGLKLTVAKTGTYTVKWIAKRDSSSNTWGTGLYIDNVLYGSKNEVWGATYTLNNVAQTTSIATFQKNEVEHVNLTEGQVVEIYGKSGSNGNWLYLHALSIEEE